MSAVENYNPDALAMFRASDVVGDVALDPMQTSSRQARLMLLAALYPMLAKASDLTNSGAGATENVSQLLQTYQTLINNANATFEQIHTECENLQAFLTQLLQTLPKEGEDLGTVLKQGVDEFISAMQRALPDNAESSALIQSLSQSMNDEIAAITQEAETPEQSSVPQISYMQAVLQMVSALMMLSVQIAQTEADNSQDQTDFMTKMKDSMSIAMTNQSNNIYDQLQRQQKLKRRMFFVSLITPQGMLGAIGQAIGGDKGNKIASFIADKLFSVKGFMNPQVALATIALKGAEERYDIKTPKEHFQDLGQKIGGDIGSQIATVWFQLHYGSTTAVANEGGKKALDAIGNDQLTETLKKVEDTHGAYAIDLGFTKLFEAIASNPDAEWIDSAARWSTVAFVATAIITAMVLSAIFAPEMLPEESEAAAELAAETGVAAGEAGAQAVAEESASVIDQMAASIRSVMSSLGEKITQTRPTTVLAVVQTLMAVYKMYYDTANTITYTSLAKLQEDQGEITANLQTMRRLLDMNQQAMQSSFQIAQNQVASLTQSQNVYAVTNQARFAAETLA